MRNFLSTAALTAIATMLAPAAWAQSAPQASAPADTTAAAASNFPPEIIVTAQKRSESIQHVPIAITAVSAEQLADRQIEGIADLATSLPGVKFAEFSGAGNVYIRGVGTTLTTGAGESSIAQHIDGIYIGTPIATTMVQDDLARIEVLRGPQSTLYGRNSTGGVINYISNAPTSTFEATASALYGNYNREQVQADISGPLSDNVRIRVYGKYQDRDGWTLNTVTGQKLDGIKQGAGRIALDATPTSNWTIKARLTADHESFAGPDFDAYYPALTFPGMNLDPREVSSPTISNSYKELWVASLRNELKLGDFTLSSLTGYVNFAQGGHYDGIAAQYTPVTIDRASYSRDFSEELNLTGTKDKLDIIAGLYYFQSDKQVNPSITNYGLLLPGVPNNIELESSKQRSYSAFGDLTYHVSDKFRLYGGLRVALERLNENLFITDACDAANTERYKGTGVAGRFGGQYDVDGTTMVYAQYSHGYKPGGFSSTTCDNEYMSESIDAGEAGLKKSFGGGRGTFNVSAYYYSVKNLQFEEITVGGSNVINAPKARNFGGEIATAFNIVSGLRADLSGAYVNAKYTDFVRVDGTLGPPANLAGFPLNNAPKFTGTAALEERAKLTDSLSLKMRGEVTYSSSYFVREFDEPYTFISPYAMVNAFVEFGLHNNKYTIRGFGRNLTNKTLLQSAIGFIGVPLGSFNAPRTYGVEGTVHF